MRTVENCGLCPKCLNPTNTYRHPFAKIWCEYCGFVVREEGQGMTYKSPEEKIEALECKVEALESKLAKAVEALEWISAGPGNEEVIAEKALSEIKGE